VIDISKALGYSIPRWPELMLYATDGKLKIDNNPVENSIRPVTIGKKIIYLPVFMKQQIAVPCFTP